MKPWMAFGALIQALLLAPSLFAQTSNINDLNRKLEAVHAQWSARESAVSAMSPSEWRGLLGANTDEKPEIQFEAAQTQNATHASLPSSFDWRNVKGVNWVSPILDQGQCGSCVAFAAVGALETQYKIDSHFAGFEVKFSPQHLFSCGGGSCDGGWQPDSAAAFLMKKGVPDEACMPYTSGEHGKDVSCRKTCSDAAQRSFRIATYSQPTRSAVNLDAIKLALQHGPLVTIMNVYSDFMSYGSGIYKHVTGSIVGSHAISIVAYNDAERSLTIRNSWGPDWGEHGFVRISYDDVSGVGSSTWSYYLQPVSGVSVQEPADQTSYIATVPIHVTSTVSAGVYLQATVFDKSGSPVLIEDISGKGSINASSLADGRYEIEVSALDSNGKTLATSQHRYFYLVNSQPKIQLALLPAAGTKPDQPLQGTVSFLIQAAVSGTPGLSPLPLSSVEFHYKKTGGKEVVAKTSSVENGTQLKWRTNLIANGRYDTWLTGGIQTAQKNFETQSAHRIVEIKNPLVSLAD